MADLVYDKDGKAFEVAFDKDGKQVLVPAKDEIRPTRPTEKPLWQSSVPMSVLQEGPSVEGLLSGLPVAGGIVGGMIGGGIGLGSAPATGGIPAPALAAGGAAAGGAIGKGLENIGRWAVGAPVPGAMSQAVDVMKAGAEQGAQELLGQGAGRLLQGAAAPGRGSLDPEILAAQRRLAASPEGAGLELPASSLATSRPVAYAEATAAEGFGGGGAAARIKGAASHLTAIADHTVARASAAADDTARGEAIERGFQAFRQAWIQTKNSLYREADRAMPNFRTAMPDTVRMLRQIVAEKTSAKRVGQAGPAADAGFYEGLLDGLTKTVERPSSRTLPGQTLMGQATAVPVMEKQTVLRNVQAKDIQNFLKELQAKVQAAYSEPFAAGNKGQLVALKRAMTREYERALAESSPELAQKFAAAKASYQEGIRKINSSFGRSIVALAKEGKYDSIARAVVSPRMSVAQIPAIKEVVGQEGTEAMQAAALASLVAKAKVMREGAAPTLSPKGLETAAKAFGWDRLKALLSPEQFQRLMDLTKTTGSLGRSEKIIFGSPTAGKGRWMAYGSALTGAAMGHPEALAYLAGDVAFNRFVSSKAGQQWLTTGFPRLGAWAGAAGRQAPRVVKEYYLDEGDEE